jgi:hypothetical protein
LVPQDRLLKLTDDIGARLEYFKELEYATRMLNHPGESLVLQTDFLYMVERVDICIDYLKSHVHLSPHLGTYFFYPNCYGIFFFSGISGKRRYISSDSSNA